ncbi:MAG: Rap1a/Tai family immunity protein [Thermodesulfovibrionales bacterium]
MKMSLWVSVLLVLVIVLTITPTQSFADFYKGNSLVTLMYEYDKFLINTKEANLEKTAEYIGYIMGVYDATNFLYDIPSGVNKGQILAIVSKYLKDHPQEWNDWASNLVIKAFSDSFSLKKKK